MAYTKNRTDTLTKVFDAGEVKPYEKAAAGGPGVLTDRELLAVLLRTGTAGIPVEELAGRVLAASGSEGLLGLQHMTLEEFRRIHGIGTVRAVQLVCLCEMARRMSKQSAQRKLDFSCPRAVADYYMEDLRHLTQEKLMSVMLDGRCRLLRDDTLTIGTVNASLITPREVYAAALKSGAVSVLLLHNHPSGDPSPSPQDRAVTERVRRAGQILGISLADHIIIGDNCYYSFAESGLLETRQKG